MINIMSVNKVKLFIFVSYFLLKCEGLDKIDSKKDIISETEAVIRNTTNNLFLALNFGKQVNPNIKQALLLHTFFTSITLKDHDTLNSVVKLSRANKAKLNSEIEHCVHILNEIIYENWNNAAVDNLANNEGIVEYIDEFTNDLNEFKEHKGLNYDSKKLKIKDEIIHILKSGDPSQFNPLLNKNISTNIEDDDFLSDSEFWVPEPSRRIYQGQKTKIKYFPFIASIQVFRSFQCAGSIIKSDLIITAASCLQLAWNNRFFRENPAFLSVRVGSNYHSGGGEDIPVLEVYFHPDYNPKNLRNNIALLRLLRHLKFRRKNRKVKKIEIDRQSSPLSLATDGVTILGWGAKGRSNILLYPYHNQLAFAVLDIYHLEECQEIYSRQYVTRQNFCAGFYSLSGGACNHDVGGPGVVNGVLAGVISFGSPVCGAPDAPTVFTKVGYFADWIEHIMELDVPVSYKKTTPMYPRTFETPHPSPSTFKLSPLSLGEKIEKEILTGASLRLLHDEQAFNEFLSTIFDSKEVNNLKELFNEFPVKKTLEFPENQTKSPMIRGKETDRGAKLLINEHFGSNNAYEPKNVAMIYENDNGINKSRETYSYKQSKQESHETIEAGDVGVGPYYNDTKNNIKRFTIFDKNMMFGEEENDTMVENNLIRLDNNVDVSETSDDSETSKERASEQKEDVDDKQNENSSVGGLVTQKPNIITDERKQKKSIDEALTLLYVSDNEENNSLDDIGDAVGDIDEDFSQGMPISADGFRDFTFRNNVTRNNSTKSILDFISRGELYDYLSEAIDEVAKYRKPVNRSYYFLLLSPLLVYKMYFYFR